MSQRTVQVPLGRDPFEFLHRRIDALQRELIEMRNNTIPTIPIYDYNSLPDDPVEGQQAIIVNAPDFAYPGASDRAAFFTNTTTISAGQNWTWDWTYSAGSTSLLDLTDPANPAIITSGVYAIAATMLGTARTSGETATISLDADVGGLAFFSEDDFPLKGQPNSPATHFPAGTAYCPGWHIDAGNTIDAVGWHSNATDLSFKFFSYIQRIS